MKSQTRVVVIGGGIAGCSTLYHLTQEGWINVVLGERNELASGTTWHSAAQVANFGTTQTMVGLKSHSIKLYDELAEDPINYHHSDGRNQLANTEAHMDGYCHFASVAKGMGVNFETKDAKECAGRHPLISTDNLLGGLWDPLDGIDPNFVNALCPDDLDRVMDVLEGAFARLPALTEVNGFNRYEITGPGARDWLDTMTCGRVPRRDGKVGLCYLLNDHGNIKTEATPANLDANTIWYGSAATATAC